MWYGVFAIRVVLAGAVKVLSAGAVIGSGLSNAKMLDPGTPEESEKRLTVSAINAINWIRVPAGLWNRYNQESVGPRDQGTNVIRQNSWL